jgi:hypothetical protein
LGALRRTGTRASLFLLPLLQSNGGTRATTGSGCGILRSKTCFGRALRDFDFKEKKNPVPSRPGELGRQKIILIARNGAKDLVGPALHLPRINNCNTKEYHDYKKRNMYTHILFEAGKLR